jgi:hypothetical protein
MQGNASWTDRQGKHNARPAAIPETAMGFQAAIGAVPVDESSRKVRCSPSPHCAPTRSKYAPDRRASQKSARQRPICVGYRPVEKDDDFRVVATGKRPPFRHANAKHVVGRESRCPVMTVLRVCQRMRNVRVRRR